MNVNRLVTQATMLVLIGGGMVAVASCSGGNGIAPSSTPSSRPAQATTSHAIHVLITEPDGSRRQADFGPGTDVSFTGNGGTATQVQTHRIGRHKPLAPMIVDAGGALVVAPPTVDDPGTDIEATAWMLVARAADACDTAGPGPLVSAVVPPWSTAPGASAPDWYVYSNQGLGSSSGVPLPSDCSYRLYLEQNLVCVADKLAAIADAVGDVTWPSLNRGPLFESLPGSPFCDPALQVPYPWGTYTYGEGDAAIGSDDGSQTCEFSFAWDIPPQADADRFIVRDLAIHTLAMIPVLDSYADISGQSCASSFASVASGQRALNPTTDSDTIAGVFGSSLGYPGIPIFPPSNVPYVDAHGNSNMQQIAQTALDIEAQILRTSGRLLHDLVRRDVYSDLAAASQQAGQALDPVMGNENAWGQDTVGGTLYGTISHAGRVLLKRFSMARHRKVFLSARRRVNCAVHVPSVLVGPA